MTKQKKQKIKNSLLASFSVLLPVSAILGASIPIHTKTSSTNNVLSSTHTTTNKKNKTTHPILASISNSNSAYISLNQTYNSALANNLSDNTIAQNPLANLNGFLNALLNACIEQGTSDYMNNNYYYDFVMSFGGFLGGYLWYLADNDVYLSSIQFIPINTQVSNQNSSGTPIPTTSALNVQLQLTFNGNLSGLSSYAEFCSSLGLSNFIKEYAQTTKNFNSKTVQQKQETINTYEQNAGNIWILNTNPSSQQPKQSLVFYSNLASNLTNTNAFIFNFTDYMLSNSSSIPVNGQTYTDGTTQYNAVLSTLLNNSTLSTAFNQFVNVSSSSNLQLNAFAISLNPTPSSNSLLDYYFGVANPNAGFTINNTVASNFGGYRVLSINPQSADLNKNYQLNSNLGYVFLTFYTVPSPLIKVSGYLDGSGLYDNQTSLDCYNIATKYNIYITQTFINNLFQNQDNDDIAYCYDPAICNYLTTTLFNKSSLSITGFEIKKTNSQYEIVAVYITDTKNTSFTNPFLVANLNGVTTNSTYTQSQNNFYTSANVYMSGSLVPITNPIALTNILTNANNTSVSTESGAFYGNATIKQETDTNNTGLSKITQFQITKTNQGANLFPTITSQEFASTIYLNLSNSPTQTLSKTNLTEFNYDILPIGINVIAGINVSYTISDVSDFVWTALSAKLSSNTVNGGAYVATCKISVTNDGVQEDNSYYALILLAPTSNAIANASTQAALQTGTYTLSSPYNNVAITSSSANDSITTTDGKCIWTIKNILSTSAYSSGEVINYALNELTPISSDTQTQISPTSSSVIISKINVPASSLIAFKNDLENTILTSSSNTPSLVQFILKLFFPNWMNSSNDLKQIFDMNSNFNTNWSSNTNWIQAFISTLMNDLNDGDSTITWTAPSLTTAQELSGSQTLYTYQFDLTFESSQQVISSSTNNYNLAQILANTNIAISNSAISNTSNLLNNLFNNNLGSNSINLNNLDLNSFYELLLDGASSSNYNLIVSSYLSHLLNLLYLNSDLFAAQISTLLSLTASPTDVSFAVYDYNNNEGEINNVGAFISYYVNGQWSCANITLSDIFSFSLNSATTNINISNVQNASQWMQYLSNWKNGGVLLNNNYTFPSAYFNDISTLTFMPNNISLNNDSYNYYDNSSLVSKNVFNYNATTGWLDTNSNSEVASWCTWNSFASFLNAIVQQTTTAGQTGIFNGINNLVIANVNFSDVSVPNNQSPATFILNQLLVWFPNLTSLTLQNVGLTGNINLDVNNNTTLKNINLNNNALTSIEVPQNLSVLDVSHNDITTINGTVSSTSSNNNNGSLLYLPSKVFNVSYNDLTNQTLPSINIPSSNLASINLSHNKLTSFSLDDWYNQNIASSGTNLNAFYTNIDVSYNNLLSSTMSSFANWNASTINDGIWSLYTPTYNDSSNKDTLPYINLDLSNQNAQGYWLYAINKSSLTPLANKMTGLSWYSNDLYGIPLALTNYNGTNTTTSGLVGALNPKFKTGSIQTMPSWFTKNTSYAGLIAQNTFYQFENDPSGLNDLYTNSANNQLTTNGNYLLNAFDMANSTIAISNTNGTSSPAITYNQFINNYDGIIPLNAMNVYNLLKANLNSLNITFNVLQSIYSQNFNLAGQSLQYYSTSNAPSYITSFLNNKDNLQMGYGGSSYIYGIAYPNQNNTDDGVIVLAQPGASGYYATSISNNYTASNAVYSTITISNVSNHNTLNMRVVLTNSVSNFYNSTSYKVITPSNYIFSNVDEISLNRVWSLNGTSGFYNLSSSGILDTLSLNPFSNGVDYALYYNFITKIYSTTYKYNNLLELLSNNTDANNISSQVNLILSDWGKNNYEAFENNVYTLLQQEGIIQYNATTSLYGTYNNNQFTFSNTFLNSNLTFNQPSNTGSYTYGINATQANNNSTAGTINNPDETSFYQTSIWANFINTQINAGTSKKPNYETIGHYLYEQGNWNYQMPDYNNALFNNATAKQAYNNILSLYNLSNNLTSTQFNEDITTYFPNLVIVANASNSINDSSKNTLDDNLAKYYNSNTLYTSFAYTQGTITNQYNFYTSNSNVYAYSLSYINMFSNVANNNQTYEFTVNLYGPSFFSNNNSSIINPNSLVLNSQVFSFALTNNKSYTWTQLEQNEADNLIPLAVYNNEDVVDGTYSSDWVPVQNYASLYATENKEFIRNLAVGIVCGLLVLSMVGVASYLLVRNNKAKTRRRKEGNDLTKRRREEYQVQLQEVKNDEEWE